MPPRRKGIGRPRPLHEPPYDLDPYGRHVPPPPHHPHPAPPPPHLHHRPYGPPPHETGWGFPTPSAEALADAFGDETLGRHAELMLRDAPDEIVVLAWLLLNAFGDDESDVEPEPGTAGEAISGVTESAS